MGKKSTGEQLPEIPTNSAPAGKRRKKPGCLATIGIILIVLIVIAGVGTTINNHNKQVEYENQTFTWPTSGLATLLPEPATNKGQIISSNDTSLSVEVHGCDEASYSAYLKQCQDAGFTVEASSSSDSYDAYDEEGNKLRLNLYKSTDEMDIVLDKAEEFDSLVWPTTGLAANLPAPASTMGKIITDSSSAWKATMGQTDKAAYKAYVEEVFAAGFDQNYDKGDESFTADNTNGLHVEIRYTGANTMSVGSKSQKAKSGPIKTSPPHRPPPARQAVRRMQAPQRQPLTRQTTLKAPTQPMPKPQVTTVRRLVQTLQTRRTATWDNLSSTPGASCSTAP